MAAKRNNRVGSGDLERAQGEREKERERDEDPTIREEAR